MPGQRLFQLGERTMKPGKTRVRGSQRLRNLNGFRVFVDPEQGTLTSKLAKDKTAMATPAERGVNITPVHIANQMINGLIEQHRTVPEVSRPLFRHSESSAISGGMSSSPEDSSSHALQRSSLQSSSLLPWPISTSFFCKWA